MLSEELIAKTEKIKLLISDMDGTLFHSDKTVSQRTIDAIEKAREKGIEFTVNTGRSYVWLGDYIKYLGIEHPIVGSNGCEIVDGKTGERLYCDAINNGDLMTCIRFCLEHKFSFYGATAEGWIIPHYLDNMDTFNGFYPDAELNGFSYDKVLKVYENSDLSNLPVFHLVIWVIYGNEGELLHEMSKDMSELELIHSAKNIFELLPRGSNKGKSFLKLCDIMGIAPDECCAFGDFYNDFPMLQKSGISVAMANAPEDIREQVDFVTDTNNNDGVAKAIEELFLN